MNDNFDGWMFFKDAMRKLKPKQMILSKEQDVVSLDSNDDEDGGPTFDEDAYRNKLLEDFIKLQGTQPLQNQTGTDTIYDQRSAENDATELKPFMLKQFYKTGYTGKEITFSDEIARQSKYLLNLQKQIEKLAISIAHSEPSASNEDSVKKMEKLKKQKDRLETRLRVFKEKWMLE